MSFFKVGKKIIFSLATKKYKIPTNKLNKKCARYIHKKETQKILSEDFEGQRIGVMYFFLE